MKFVGTLWRGAAVALLAVFGAVAAFGTIAPGSDPAAQPAQVPVEETLALAAHPSPSS